MLKRASCTGCGVMWERLENLLTHCNLWVKGDHEDKESMVVCRQANTGGICGGDFWHEL